MAEAEVRLMVPVPVTVRLVEAVVNTAPEPLKVQVPEPNARVLIFCEMDSKFDPDVVVKLYVLASNVPAACVKLAPVEVTNAS